MLAADVVPEHRRPRKCRGKVALRSLEYAQEALCSLREQQRAGVKPNQDRDDSHPLTIYACEGPDGCGFWHIGHRPSR